MARSTVLQSSIKLKEKPLRIWALFLTPLIFPLWLPTPLKPTSPSLLRNDSIAKSQNEVRVYFTYNLTKNATEPVVFQFILFFSFIKQAEPTSNDDGACWRPQKECWKKNQCRLDQYTLHRCAPSYLYEFGCECESP